MGTATVHTLPQQDSVDKMINRTVKALLAVRDMDPDTFRESAGLPKSTYYNRLSGRNGWSAAEVKRAADALGVSVATLYDGLLPHLDSNQKPAELRQRTNVVSLADYRTRRNIERRPYDATARRRAPDSDLATVHFLTVSAAS